MSYSYKLEVFIRVYDGYWVWVFVGYFLDAEVAKKFAFRTYPSKDFKITNVNANKLIYKICDCKEYVKIYGITDDGLDYCIKQVFDVDGVLQEPFRSWHHQSSTIANICHMTERHIRSYNTGKCNSDWKKVGF